MLTDSTPELRHFDHPYDISIVMVVERDLNLDSAAQPGDIVGKLQARASMVFLEVEHVRC